MEARELEMKYSSSCIGRITDATYMQEYLRENGVTLYFIMQRADEQVEGAEGMRDFWIDFAKYDINLPVDTTSGETSRGEGTLVFIDTLSKYYQHNQLWVVFISTSPVTAENLFPPYEDIVMYLTVTTTATFPASVHMGIERTAAFFGKSKRGTGGISIPLHSFAAKVMLILYPHKLYVMSGPAKGMLKIIKRTFEYRKDFFTGKTSIKALSRGFYDSRLEQLQMFYFIASKLDERENIASIYETERESFHFNELASKEEKDEVEAIFRDASALIQNRFADLALETRSKIDDERNAIKRAEERLGHSLPSPSQSPVVVLDDRYRLFDPSRTVAVVEYIFSSRTVIIRDAQTSSIIAEDTDKEGQYGWFFRRMEFKYSQDNYTTINILPLANADKKSCFSSFTTLSLSTSKRSRISSFLSSRESGNVEREYLLEKEKEMPSVYTLFRNV